MSELPPLQEGLHALFEGEPRLLANRCDACERVFFPRRQYCGRCASPVLREVTLSRRGRIHAWSLIDRKPKYAVIDPPYVQAEVAMPEGVHVFTVLEGADPAMLRFDQPVEVHLAEVPAPQGEGRVKAYVFRTVAGEGTA